MADQITTDEQGRTYRNGVLQAPSSASPGVGGAISDMVGALAKAFAPKSITQRGSKVKAGVDEGEGNTPPSGNLGDQF